MTLKTIFVSIYVLTYSNESDAEFNNSDINLYAIIFNKSLKHDAFFCNSEKRVVVMVVFKIL